MARVALLAVAALVVLVSCAAAAAPVDATKEAAASSNDEVPAEELQRTKRRTCQILIAGPYRTAQGCLTDSSATADAAPAEAAKEASAPLADVSDDEVKRAKRDTCRVTIRGSHSGSIDCLTEPAAAATDDAVDTTAATAAAPAEAMKEAAAPLADDAVPADELQRPKRKTCQIIIAGPYRTTQGCLTDSAGPALDATHNNEDARAKRDLREVNIGGSNSGRVCGPGDLRCTVRVGGVDSGVINGEQPGYGQSRYESSGMPQGHPTGYGAYNSPERQWANAPYGDNAPQGGAQWAPQGGTRRANIPGDNNQDVFSS